MAASQEEAVQKLVESEKRLGDLEAENEELFSKATTAEEEVDATTGKLFAADSELKNTRQQLEEAEQRVQQLSESRQQEASEVRSRATRIRRLFVVRVANFILWHTLLVQSIHVLLGQDAQRVKLEYSLHLYVCCACLDLKQQFTVI